MCFLFYNFDLIKEGFLPLVAQLLYDKSVVLLSKFKAYSIHPFSSKAVVFYVNIQTRNPSVTGTHLITVVFLFLGSA